MLGLFSETAGLVLGPTNPLTTNVAGETLGFRRFGFSPNYVLLMPAFSLSTAPINLTIYLHCGRNAPLPSCPLDEKFQKVKKTKMLVVLQFETSCPKDKIWNFGIWLNPRSSSALILHPPKRRVNRPVSCYAFFKGWLPLSQPPGCL